MGELFQVHRLFNFSCGIAQELINDIKVPGYPTLVSLILLLGESVDYAEDNRRVFGTHMKGK